LAWTWTVYRDRQQFGLEENGLECGVRVGEVRNGFSLYARCTVILLYCRKDGDSGTKNPLVVRRR